MTLVLKLIASLGCLIFAVAGACTYLPDFFFSVGGNPAERNRGGKYRDPGDREDNPHEHLFT